MKSESKLNNIPDDLNDLTLPENLSQTLISIRESSLKLLIIILIIV